LPTKTHTDDPECIIVQSFRSSSSANVAFRLIQRFVAKHDDSNPQKITIGFWSIPSKDIPVDVQIPAINNVKIVDDEYHESGNIQLLSEPHNQTKMTINVEIKFKPEHLKTVGLDKKLYLALDRARMANEFFDRSKEVDQAVINHFVNFVMPKADKLSDVEERNIQRCKDLLSWGDAAESWKRLPGTLVES